MYSPVRLAAKYLAYYLAASNGSGHGIHSPFVFDFINRVLIDKKKYPDYERVEALRRELLGNKGELDVLDLGAGPGKGSPARRPIASIARFAAKPAKYGQLLYRIVRHYQPASLIELGTSLGITSSYLSLAAPAGRVLTLEGSPAIATVATASFERLQLSNISLMQGHFDDTLPAALDELGRPDFVFVDGNHREEPTLRYFGQVCARSHNDTIVVFDDIHWSSGMEKAWERIKDHPSVRCSIDLFFIGLIFFREEFYEKQHFTIRF
ncbi:MAG: class I SAM-dependent methyltransferase [Luteolibacter sp.]